MGAKLSVICYLMSLLTEFIRTILPEIKQCKVALQSCYNEIFVFFMLNVSIFKIHVGHL